MNHAIFNTKIILITVLYGFYSTLFATNYYVSAEHGRDTNFGLSPEEPLLNINKAIGNANPGDTIFVMNGTYSAPANNPLADVVTINKSGTETRWIILTGYKTDTPVISFKGWSGIKIAIGASYIEICGFTIRGNNANISLDSALNQPYSCANKIGIPSPLYNGVGIRANARDDGRHSHHIIIINNTIFDCGESGISLIQADYITIEKNKVFNNCWYSIYAGSGITLYQLWNYDTIAVNYHNIILNNICYGNHLFVPWTFGCKITDGNGIIIDDSKNTQNNSKNGRYNGRTLIANNIVFNNGGSGIHSFSSEHVDIFNNTAYKNQQSKELDEGEIFSNGSNDVNIKNNILVSENNKRITSNWNNKGVSYDYNIYWGGKQTDCSGIHSKILDPLFVNPSKDPIVANFHLKDSSPSIRMGDSIKSLFKFRKYFSEKTFGNVGAVPN